MSDVIKHECGLALIRLLKPLSYYQEKYNTPFYGLYKMQHLMQKQRNRGQDGAGLVTIKLDHPAGERYISRKRSNTSTYLQDIFEDIFSYFDDVAPEKMMDSQFLKNNFPFMGEVLLGHLRYGTFGKNSIESVHPFLRLNNWKNRNLALAGNFNMTNVEELFNELIEIGQYPKEKSDTVTVLEKIGHFLDDEVHRLHSWFKPDGYSNQQINSLIEEHLDIQRLLQRATRKFDGGYAMAGLIGFGDAFVCRDPHGIRPGYYYKDEEVVVFASERPAIQTVFGVNYNKIEELQPGHALIIKKNGTVSEKLVRDPYERAACSFERIYFSRGNDKDIYQERKKFGYFLANDILEAIEYDIENTIFSFIPNTAETSFYGMIEGVTDFLCEWKKKRILELKENMTEEGLEKILRMNPRIEKIAIKDEKMRTFIANDNIRKNLVPSVYDVTYGCVRNKIDNLVLIDDSIVRGTTLRDSIISIVNTLKPKKIVIVSSAPQIRFPDCYGIDMSKMADFAAFRALVSLLKDDGKEHLLEETLQKCQQELDQAACEINHLKYLYSLYTDKQIADRMATMLTPKNVGTEVKLIFQSIKNLHKACPNHTGDWYFSGNYPTPGGMKVVNRAFVNFMENKNVRAYF